MFEIGLTHFLVVSIFLAAAGVATMLTKRNAIGILMGVELVLNAAGVNFIAFNYFAHPNQNQPYALTAAQVEQYQQSAQEAPTARPEILLHDVLRPEMPGLRAVALLEDAKATGGSTETVKWQATEGAEVTLQYAIYDGMIFAIFVIVLAAAEAAVALAIFLNFYNNFSTIDLERADEMRG